MRHAQSDNVVQLIDLVKHFDSHVAVDGVTLDIPRGEFFSVVGPSGCGKTTTLRLIAGFERPTSGHIILDGASVENVPPYKRPLNTVFQSYALFPHLNVFQNVSFGLRRRRIGRAEVDRQVREALELVNLSEFAKRRPTQLSGGQRQRVALARALVLQPRVLLLDEPLSALDAKLRKRLQVQLKVLQEQVGITFIYVTHDQNEALSMSDRIAVMKDGRVQQVGTPRDIYEAPKSRYVADFLGAANLLKVNARGGNGSGACRIEFGEVTMIAELGNPETSGSALAMIHPEQVRLQPADAPRAGVNWLTGTVERSIYLGNTTRYIVRLDAGGSIEAEVNGSGGFTEFDTGTQVGVQLAPKVLRVLEDR